MALTPTTPDPAEDKRAKRKAAEDEIALREIDDAVRQDQYADFAKTYGVPLLVVAVLGMLAFAGYLFWNSQQEAAMEENSEALVGALDQVDAGNLDTAAQTLATQIEEGSPASAASAAMLSAGLALEGGRAEEAAGLYAQVAADDDAPPALRDLARIREVAAGFDTMDKDEVIAKLEPLAQPGNPWFGSAGELVAMAYLEKGMKAEAGALFGSIAKDENVPSSLQARARQMAGLLGVDAIEDVDEVLEEQGAVEAAPE